MSPIRKLAAVVRVAVLNPCIHFCFSHDHFRRGRFDGLDSIAHGTTEEFESYRAVRQVGGLNESPCWRQAFYSVPRAGPIHPPTSAASRSASPGPQLRGSYTLMG